MKPDLAKILIPSRHPVGEDNCRATITRQWLLEQRHLSGDHAIVQNSHLDFFICASEAFPEIEADISRATKSVDLICFGFDPAMEISLRHGATWPRGKRYGDLLLEVANRGVVVRLLVWYAGDGHLIEAAGRMANNLPGHPAWSSVQDKKSPDYAIRRYREDWWDNAMQTLPRSSSNPFTRCSNLHVRHRALPLIDTMLTVGPSDLTNIQKMSLVRVGTHHQKPILIDYEVPEAAVGYVMGLNSLTDYWDTPRHRYDEPLRGKAWEGSADKKNPMLGLKPYRDYAIRVEGPALVDLNRNFTAAWDSAEKNWNPHHQDFGAPGSLVAHRMSANKERLVARAAPNCKQVQILRTDAISGDQTIQELYWLVTNQARQYLYIENQYFQNDEWAALLKERRQITLRGLKNNCGMAKEDIPPLHVFIVIPEPEQDGMIPATYDTIAALGQGQQMAKYDAGVKQFRELTPGPDDRMLELAKKYLRSIGKLDSPLLNDMKDSAKKPVVTKADMDKLGIKVLIAKLYTQDQRTAATREIYIHSKLLIADDVFFTLGSANLNVRSMCCDGEINIAGTDPAWIKTMRKRVWSNIAGELDGGDGSLKNIEDTHSNWIKKMDKNAKTVKYQNDRLDAHIVTFSDDRGITLSPRISQRDETLIPDTVQA